MCNIVFEEIMDSYTVKFCAYLDSKNVRKKLVILVSVRKMDAALPSPGKKTRSDEYLFYFLNNIILLININ